MTTAELKEYLGMVVQTEKEIDLQERLCQQLKQRTSTLSNSITQLEKRARENVVPERPKNSENCTRGLILSGACCSLLTIIFCVGFLAFYCNMKSFSVYFGIFAEFIIWGQLLLEIRSRKKSNQKRYNRALKKYEAECEKVQNKSDLINNQLIKATIQKQTAEAYLQQIESALVSGQRNLQALYAHNVIFPKYRNYIMVSSIYEYLLAGRCSTLEGHEGAYNILELEIRFDRVITQLDSVLKNLEAIQANQYTLYSCLQESNQKIDALLHEESQIAASLQEISVRTSSISARLAILLSSSEFNNYLEDCSRRELEYMNRANRIF